MSQSVTGWRRGRALDDVRLDGQEVTAYEGETIAGLLWRLDAPECRRSEIRDEPRGYFCGMGVCFECSVTVDGQHGVRACMARVQSGQRIERERGHFEIAGHAGA